MLPDNDDTDVGYGRPPKRNRFRKGQSGNPKGRPKGKLNSATVLEQALQKRVVINENGVRRTITKLEAMYTQLVNQAASGNLTAVKLLTALLRFGEEQADQEVQPGSQAAEADQKVLQTLLRRLRGATKETDHDPDPDPEQH
jgi:hypothetical protein